MATRKSTKERIGRLGGSDTRTGPERFMSAISAGLSKDKKQGRKWDDSPETVAKNKRATAKRLEEEAKRRKR